MSAVLRAAPSNAKDSHGRGAVARSVWRLVRTWPGGNFRVVRQQVALRLIQGLPDFRQAAAPS